MVYPVRYGLFCEGIVCVTANSQCGETGLGRIIKIKKEFRHYPPHEAVARVREADTDLQRNVASTLRKRISVC